MAKEGEEEEEIVREWNRNDIHYLPNQLYIVCLKSGAVIISCWSTVIFSLHISLLQRLKGQWEVTFTHFFY